MESFRLLLVSDRFRKSKLMCSLFGASATGLSDEGCRTGRILNHKANRVSGTKGFAASRKWMNDGERKHELLLHCSDGTILFGRTQPVKTMTPN